MTHRNLFSLCATITLALLIGPAAFAQQKAPYKAPRTEYGYPNLQGNWTNATITPLERPAKFGERRAHTTEEWQALEKAELDGIADADKPTDPKKGIQDLPTDCGRGFTGVNCGYNAFWVDPGTKLIDINGEKRTSMIIDPPNGRLPPVVAAAQARQADRRARFRGAGMADGPEIRSLGERCLMSFGSSAGPPMIPLLYNNNYQIVQTKDTVTILVEMVHDARVVRIGGEHLPNNIRKWMGDSIGHYEGDTLVVETTNFNEQQNFRGASENLKVVERFTRIGPGQILYRFTVEDPTTFEKPFTGEIAMNASQGNIYEYACHEGNYALPGILAGAREQERAAAVEKK
jgi:hypothetical protein